MASFTHFSRLERTVATLSALLRVGLCVCVCVCNCQDGGLMTLWICSRGVANEAYVYGVLAPAF